MLAQGTAAALPCTGPMQTAWPAGATPCCRCGRAGRCAAVAPPPYFPKELPDKLQRRLMLALHLSTAQAWLPHSAVRPPPGRGVHSFQRDRVFVPDPNPDLVGAGLFIPSGAAAAVHALI